MSYFKNLVKEIAEDKTVRAAQIERLTLKGKYPEAIKVFISVGQSILRDTGITTFKLLESGSAKDRNFSIIYEIVFNVFDNKLDAKSIENSAKDFLGKQIKFNMYIKDSEIRMYLEIPIEGK